MRLTVHSRYVVILGTIVIWVIKLIVRPYVPVPNVLQPLVDAGPNFIGSYLIPFAAFGFFRSYFKTETVGQLRLTCLTGLVLVVINEYLQLIRFFGRTFDFLDIGASFIGVLVGQAVFQRLMWRRSLNGADRK